MTIDAIQKVIELTNIAVEGNCHTTKIPAVITIDGTIAFNSVTWDLMVEKIKAVSFEPHLRKMLEKYLQEQRMVVESRGMVEMLK